MLRTQVHPGLEARTLIATEEMNMEIQELYKNKRPFLAWCYNYQDSLYELQKVIIHKHTPVSRMVEVLFDDNTRLITSFNYPIKMNIGKVISSGHSKDTALRVFEMTASQYINHYPNCNRRVKNTRIIKLSTPTYSIVGEKFNNCAVITSESNLINQGVIINI